MKPSTKQLHEIIRIQTAIAQRGLDLGGVMQYIVEQTLPLVKADGSVIELAEDGEMVYRAAAGIAANQVGLRLNIATSLSGLCVRTGQIFNCADSRTDPRVDRDACERIGLRSMIVLPLKHQGITVGVLKAMSKNAQQFSEGDITLIGMLCDLIAASMYFAVKYDIERLAYKATHDSLTGLANRALFMDQLKNIDAHSGEHQDALGLLMIDLDGLKQINDGIGHKAGDAVLMEFAKRLKRATRKTDLVARLGGDEFAVLLLPFTVEEVLQEALQRIDHELATPLHYDQHVLPIRASIGAARMPADGSDPVMLLDVADQRMYENKKRRKHDQ